MIPSKKDGGVILTPVRPKSEFAIRSLGTLSGTKILNSVDLIPASHSLGVQGLQSLDTHFSALEGGDAFGGGAGCGERGDGGNAAGDCGSADRFLVEIRVGAVRRVDDELDAVGFDQIDWVGAALFYFVDAIHYQAGFFELVGGAVGGYQFEAHVDEAAGDFNYSGLVVVGDADEDGALRGELLAGGELRFGERFAEVVGYAHDFSGGAHLGAENGVDSGELGPREDWRFHEEVAAGVEVFAWSKFP